MRTSIGSGLRLLWLVAFLAASGVQTARAQDSLTSRLRQYESDKKNPIVAGALEYTFPFAGYAYAGNWRGGVLPGAVLVTGVALVLPCLEPCTSEQQQRLIAGAL
jgi:hypothetical protein